MAETLTPMRGYDQIRLVTREGMIVTDLAIPPFEALPEVVLWGSRAFVKCSNPGLGTYREASSYSIPFEESDS